MLFAHNCKRETKNYTSLTKINLHNLIRENFGLGGRCTRVFVFWNLESVCREPMPNRSEKCIRIPKQFWYLFSSILWLTLLHQ